MTPSAIPPEDHPELLHVAPEPPELLLGRGPDGLEGPRQPTQRPGDPIPRRPDRPPLPHRDQATLQLPDDRQVSEDGPDRQDRQDGDDRAGYRPGPSAHRPSALRSGDRPGRIREQPTIRPHSIGAFPPSVKRRAKSRSSGDDCGDFVKFDDPVDDCEQEDGRESPTRRTRGGVGGWSIEALWTSKDATLPDGGAFRH